MHETVELGIDTLKGDLRDNILAHIKQLPNHWAIMAEKDQRDVANKIDNMVDDLIRKAAMIIKTNGRDDAVIGTLEQFTAKDGLKIVITSSNNPRNLDALGEAVGRGCVIVTDAQGEAFRGEHEDSSVHVTPDQHDLLG